MTSSDDEMALSPNTFIEPSAQKWSTLRNTKMPLSSAEKQKRYRERLKNKPECYEESKRKQRDRYHKNKRLVKDLTPKEKFNANVIWKLRKRELRKKKQNVERLLQHTPPSSPVSEPGFYPLNIQDEAPPLTPPPMSPRPTTPPSPALERESSPLHESLSAVSSVSLVTEFSEVQRLNQPNDDKSAKQRGRKKVKRDRSKVYRENVKLRKETEQLKRKCEKYKKRYHREIEKKTRKDDDLRYTVLSKAIKKTFKNTKSKKERSTIKKIFMTAEIQKSRLKKRLLTENLGADKIIQNQYHFDRATLLKKKIKDFFSRDDITRATAGKKEVLIRQGITMQKRYLLDTMKSLYKTFKKENPGLKCSYFYFTRNKPFFVVVPSVDARETCLCKLHANFAYKANALKKKGIIGTDDPNLLIQARVCDSNLKICMEGFCDNCKDKEIKYNENKIYGTIKWMEWIRKEEVFKKDGKTTKAIKNVREEKSEDIKSFIIRFEKDLATFQKHIFNIKCQFRNFRQCLEHLQATECIILVDFSENYNCKYHKEIQHHHFGGSRNQISLHTVIVYVYDYETGKGHKIHSFCSVSASCIHQPAAIWAHLDPILKWIRSQFVCINTVHFFSDGPSTQYRQKQNFFLMCTKLFDYEFENMTWSFFEAGHGKGPADGVGGFLKRTADKMVAKGEDIADVFQFYEKMSAVSKIKLFLIDDNDITDQQKALPSNIPRLLGTLKVHQVFTDSRGTLNYRELSCFCDEEASGKRGFCLCLGPKTYDVRSVISDIDPKSPAIPEVTTEVLIPKAQEVDDSSDDDRPLLELRDITNRRTNHVYEEVYGNSSGDEQPCSSYNKENAKIERGDFLLVNVDVDIGKTKVNTYKYACKAISDIEEDDEVKVMFLRVVDKKALQFRLDEKDVSYIEYKDIIERLPYPKIVKKGSRTYYYFENSVNVFEK